MDEQKVVKKKKSHYFEIYISKVLKQVCDNSGITLNCKQQLNSALCIITKHISNTALNIVIASKKKTITAKEISSAIKMTFSGILLDNSLNEGNNAIQNYKDFDKKEIQEEKLLLCKQIKAGVIFSPSLVEKFLRQFGYIKIMVNSLAPVYLAAVLEYLTYEILDISNELCKENKKVRINIRDMELAVRTDNELNNLFIKLNINLLGGGVIPFIHSSLITKPKKKLRQTENKKNNRRFHSGTVAIRNIKKQQKFSDTLIIAKLSFEHFVRHIFKENLPDTNTKISKDVFITLQHFIEQYIINILKNANFLAIHAGRIKLTPVDIGLISYLNNKSKNPYQDEEVNDLLSIIDDNDGENTEVLTSIAEELSSENEYSE
jgi:histone H2A